MTSAYHDQRERGARTRRASPIPAAPPLAGQRGSRPLGGLLALDHLLALDEHLARTGLALDGDPARLHRLRQLALEVDLQDAVGQRRTDDLDVVGEAEAALESLATL